MQRHKLRLILDKCKNYGAFARFVCEYKVYKLKEPRGMNSMKSDLKAGNAFEFSFLDGS